jgi:hypothetical protein
MKKPDILKYRKTIVIVVLIALAVPFALPGFSMFAGYTAGYQEFVMEKLKACPESKKLLGEDVGQSFVGLALGSSTTQGAFGQAQWSVPVSGEPTALRSSAVETGRFLPRARSS